MFKGIKHQNYLIGYPLPIDNLFMNPCCAGMFCGRCKIRTYGTFTGPGVFKTPGINQLSQPSKKMQFPSSTESISMPISTLSSMLLMVLYEFLQTQKLASLPTDVCIFFEPLIGIEPISTDYKSVIITFILKRHKTKIYFILQNITP